MIENYHSFFRTRSGFFFVDVISKQKARALCNKQPLYPHSAARFHYGVTKEGPVPLCPNLRHTNLRHFFGKYSLFLLTLTQTLDLTLNNSRVSIQWTLFDDRFLKKVHSIAFFLDFQCILAKNVLFCNFL